MMLRSLVAGSLAVLVVSLAVLSGWQWYGSADDVIQSEALGGPREYRVFNPGSHTRIVYVLDGQSLRNGLASAVIFSVTAFLRGEELPKIVAIESPKSRDEDFRPERSTPASWRPTIAGRSDRYDAFLVRELFPSIESRPFIRSERYLVGHSLSGLYALDFAVRHPELLDGVIAYAPTISHDTSIVKRLPSICGHTHKTYANWGLESERDTKVFENAADYWVKAEHCRKNPPVIARHFLSIHQTSMLTGQVDVALRFLNSNK
ncbi:alpha/beta hydrolase-fold protein [Pontixanthobacter sp.]|uniref:alpha/beta hydrolase-fold protein n=1 Tax=Pontixanthobacter sp. TaxID=2792078 RepID=UPI003C7B11FC